MEIGPTLDYAEEKYGVISGNWPTRTLVGTR